MFDWYTNPRTFDWFPLAGQRHAIHRQDRHVPPGTPMRASAMPPTPEAPTATQNGFGPPAHNAGTQHAHSSDSAHANDPLRPGGRAASRGHKSHQTPRAPAQANQTTMDEKL
jgi:hypothetical protein